MHHARRMVDPAPKRYIGDRITVANNEIAARQMVLNYLVMPLGFPPVAVDGVVQARGRG